jgi:hypothetical protein
VGGEGTTDLDVYRSDRRALVEQVNKLSNRNAELEALVGRSELTELDAQRARVGLHITSSLTLYTLAACFMSEPHAQPHSHGRLHRLGKPPHLDCDVGHPQAQRLTLLRKLFIGSGALPRLSFVRRR